MKWLLTWQQKLLSVPQAPDTDHYQDGDRSLLLEAKCCEDFSCINNCSVSSRSLLFICALCTSMFWWRQYGIIFFFLWEMSSKNLGLPNTHERDWTVFPLLLLFLTPAAVRWSQRWPQWWQEWPEELHKWEQREQREAVPVSWTMSSRLPENIQH